MKKTFLFMAIALLLMGCSVTPYEKGTRLAEEYNDCISDYNKELDQVGEDFAGEIQGNYDSRLKAMEDYLHLLQECHQKYLKEWEEIDAKGRAIRKKLKSSAERAEFESALENDREFYVFLSEPDLETMDISPAVIQQVKTIVPTKPNEAQIMKDLLGHTLSEGKEDGYYPRSWTWKITEGGISDLKVISTQENTNSRYTVNVSMKLNSDTRSYDTKAVVSYVLEDISDWEIEYVRSLGMDIVKTHKYDDCVKCYLELEPFAVLKSLFGENNCDIALEVAGKALSEYSDKWEKFATVVAPHEKTTISRFPAKDFKIDYIERP